MHDLEDVFRYYLLTHIHSSYRVKDPKKVILTFDTLPGMLATGAIRHITVRELGQRQGDRALLRMGTKHGCHLLEAKELTKQDKSAIFGKRGVDQKGQRSFDTK